MPKWLLKSCPKCGGDCFVDRDAEKIWFQECLQCGYYKELSSVKKEEKDV